MHQLQKNAHAGIVVVAIVILDQILKFFLFAKTGGVRWLQLTNHKNFGITANIPLPQALTIALTAGLCILIGWGIYRAMVMNRRSVVFALAILLGGALGNLIDRVFFGFVRDWLLLFGTSVVNLADGAILVGGIWYVLSQRRKLSS